MYPTWENSNHRELHIIAKTYGKVYQSSVVCKPPASMKKKATGDIELPPPKHRNLAVKAAPKPPKSPSCSKAKRWMKNVVQRDKIEEHQHGHDSKRHNNSEDPTYASSEDKFKAPSPRKASDEATPTVESPISKELECVTLSTTSDKEDEEAFHVVRHPQSSKQVIQPPATRNLTRKNGRGGKPNLSFLMATSIFFFLSPCQST